MSTEDINIRHSITIIGGSGFVGSFLIKAQENLFYILYIDLLSNCHNFII